MEPVHEKVNEGLSLHMQVAPSSREKVMLFRIVLQATASLRKVLKESMSTLHTKAERKRSANLFVSCVKVDVSTFSTRVCTFC